MRGKVNVIVFVDRMRKTERTIDRAQSSERRLSPSGLASESKPRRGGVVIFTLPPPANLAGKGDHPDDDQKMQTELLS